MPLTVPQHNGFEAIPQGNWRQRIVSDLLTSGTILNLQAAFDRVLYFPILNTPPLFLDIAWQAVNTPFAKEHPAMTTERQAESNRQNALKSTGPKTEEGKETSRRNALKHGLAGAGVVLPVFDEEVVNERMKEWAPLFSQLKGLQSFMLGELVRATVRLERALTSRKSSSAAAPRIRTSHRLLGRRSLARSR